MEKEKFKIAPVLKKGKENATTTQELLALTNIKTVRHLQAQIAKERKAGALIMSGAGAGYWLPSGRAEVEEYVRIMDSRAKNVFRAVQSAREVLKSMPGQTELFEREEK